MSINAFVDNGYSPGKEFCHQLLSSKEFTVETLERILSGASGSKKEVLVLRITDALETGKLTPEQILLPYVKQSRTWLSLKCLKPGSCTITPNLNSGAILLEETDILWSN